MIEIPLAELIECQSNSHFFDSIIIRFCLILIRLVRFADDFDWFKIANGSQSQWIESIERQLNLYTFFLDFNHYSIDVR